MRYSLQNSALENTCAIMFTSKHCVHSDTHFVTSS